MNFTKLLIFFFCCSTAFAQEKTICISVDDLPTVSYGKADDGFNLEITQKLINAFEQYNIPAIGFVNEGKLYQDGKLKQSRVELLQMWLEKGYELGNHTFSHHNYDLVEFETYTGDIIKGEKIAKSLSEKYQMPYRFFRHPYLRMGSKKTRADSLSTFLENHGYTIAPVTIDNADYLFAKAYQNALKAKNSRLMKQIGNDYIAYMEAKILFYEACSQELFGRPIAQILLCHASLLNADYMPALAEMCLKNGYTFINQSKAIEDSAYSSEITRFGSWGISWIDRWALSKGYKGDFFKNDPETPQYIQDLSSK